MYRNLEKDRKPDMKAADTAAEVDCTCVCQVTTERGREPEPEGGRSVTELQIHWKKNGG